MGDGTAHNILVVDDEFATSRMYSVILKENGYRNVYCCEDSRLAMDMVRERRIDLVLTDLIMPYVDGRELLAQISEQYPNIPVIILTSQDRVETAVECMKFGAFDFMTKPVDAGRLLNAIQHAITIRELKQEVSILSSGKSHWSLEHPEHFEDIITRSPKMHKIFAYMEAIAQSPKAVLITGESGTGKELIARSFHRLQTGKGKFVAVNVSGLDDGVFSDSLFGHKRGSFTGAEGQRMGLIEQAQDGTLFLDEIGDLQPQSQVKLLRLLQDGEYYPLGADQPERCSARIVTATNADLYQKQGDGSFRRDLYYRLIAHHVELPPLRDRPEDIPLLIDYYLAEAQNSMNRQRVEACQELYDKLADYPFPGNVRELQGLMYDLVSSSANGQLDVSIVSQYLALRGFEGILEPEVDAFSEAAIAYVPGPGGSLFQPDRLPSLKDIEHFLYREALSRTDGNQSRAARLLDVSQSTLSRYLQQLLGKISD